MQTSLSVVKRTSQKDWQAWTKR